MANTQELNQAAGEEGGRELLGWSDDGLDVYRDGNDGFEILVLGLRWRWDGCVSRWICWV